MAVRRAASSPFRRWLSAAMRLWLSASRASSSAPVTGIGGPGSPPATRAMAIVMSRNETVRLATARAAAPRPKIAAATMAAIRSGTRDRSSVSRPAFNTMLPNTASGSTAAIVSVAVRKTRNDRFGLMLRRRRAPRMRLVLPPPPSGRASADWVMALDESIPDASSGEEVDGMVGIGLDLLAQPSHRYPDIRRLRLFGVRPTARHTGLGCNDVTEIGCEGVEKPRFGGRELDFLAGHAGAAVMEVERQPRPED